jgi:hypothetical protein
VKKNKKFINNNEVELDKVINKLDQLIIEFIEIIQRYTPYVIVGEYIPILFGRSRMSEDIDVLIPFLSKDKFIQLYIDILENNYWCLNSESVDDNYGLLIDDHTIRLTRIDWVIPNVELRFITDDIDELTFKTRMKVNLSPIILEVSRPEINIYYKRNILKSDKDIEDAIHLEEIFKDQMDEELIQRCQELMNK